MHTHTLIHTNTCIKGNKKIIFLPYFFIIIAQDNLTLRSSYQTRARQKKTMKQIEQNQATLREDMDSIKGIVEGMKDKIDQLTRVITNMMAKNDEADKRKVASMSTPPPVDGNPQQGFVSNI